MGKMLGVLRVNLKLLGAIMGALLGTFTLFWGVYVMDILGAKDIIVYAVTSSVITSYTVLGYLGECVKEQYKKVVETCWRIVATVAMAGCYTALTHLIVEDIGVGDALIWKICIGAAVVAAIGNYMLWGFVDKRWAND